MNFSISFSPLFSRIALATGAGMTGACSGSEIAGAAGVGLLAVTAGVTAYLLEARRERSPIATRPAPQGSGPAIARPAPVVPQRTVFVGGDRGELRGLQHRVQFWTPYSVRVDLRGIESDQIFRIEGRRPHNGFAANGSSVPVLELADPYVSQDHATVRCEYDRNGKRWTLEVRDHSTNGTQIAGKGMLRGETRRISAERRDLTMTVGRTEVQFLFSSPPAPVARPIVPLGPHPPAPQPTAASPFRPEHREFTAEKKTLPLAQIETLVAQELPPDRRIRVFASDTHGARVEVRHSDPSRPASLLMHFPQGTALETVKTVTAFLNANCRLFAPSVEPTISVTVEWYASVPGGGIMTLSGSSPAQTIAPGSDGVGGTLTRADLRNKNGLPRASIALELPAGILGEWQARSAVLQIQDAFRRIRRALDAVNAPLEEIDPIASIFAVREG